jgi:hypothetical protein
MDEASAGSGWVDWTGNQAPSIAPAPRVLAGRAGDAADGASRAGARAVAPDESIIALPGRQSHCRLIVCAMARTDVGARVPCARQGAGIGRFMAQGKRQQDIIQHFAIVEHFLFYTKRARQNLLAACY